MLINTKKYVDVFKEVQVDDREGMRKKYALEQYSPFNPIITHLDYGDYIFIGKNGIRVVWEYKTGDDWLNSINSDSHHLHNQVYNMITNEDYCFVIIECEDMLAEIDSLYYSSGISISLPQINGALSEFSVVSSVLQTQTRYQAFDLMMRTSAKIVLQKPYKYKYGKKSTNSALNYLSAIKGLDSKAEIICKTLNLKTLKDLMELDQQKLLSVKGVGEKLADKILGELYGLQK